MILQNRGGREENGREKMNTRSDGRGVARREERGKEGRGVRGWREHNKQEGECKGGPDGRLCRVRK